MSIKDNITPEELKSLSERKVLDATILFREGRFDTAYYLCGYAVEMALKRRICLTLGWKEGYPKKKFDNLTSFKTHKLEVLLHLSGFEEKVRKDYLLVWSVVADWDPEVRYSSLDTDQQTAEAMIASTKALLEIL
ncbi:MAG TPA: hypothetical protein VLG49_03770 [Rhabdochlamydiaceae bacterium]|nr:hypothetical protein [Rhabdochlamydiaceae bacterium]